MNSWASWEQTCAQFVSIIIPAYKEEEHIAETVTDVVAALERASLEFEVIIVLDSIPGDCTGSITHELRERFSEIRLVERQGRRGVGDAIRAGIKLAKGNILVPIMGDHSEDPQDLLRLINAIVQGFHIAIGNRFRHGKPRSYPPLKYVANRCCNYLTKLLFRIPSSDTTNAFKAYRSQLLKRITISSSGFEIFLEIPLRIFMKWPNVKATNIQVGHTVRRKKETKLSLLREGPRYVWLILSLLLCRKPEMA